MKLDETVIQVAFVRAANAANTAITEICADLDSPFIHNYPFDCCELISVHLGLLLKEGYPNAEIHVAKAYDHSSDSWHCWVEIDSIVIDLTAHQFDQYNAPLVCTKPSFFELDFPDVDRLSPQDAFSCTNFENNLHIMSILKEFIN